MPVGRGVPQGSCLSPLLFNICTRNLPMRCGADAIQFADDITESHHHKDFNEVKGALEKSYSATKEFCEEKGLIINASKTQFIVMKAPSRKLPDQIALILDGVKLEPLNSVKLLGVYIDRHLNYSVHIQEIVMRCRGLLGILRKSSRILPEKLLLQFYCAIIRVHMEYCSAVFWPACYSNLQKLDVVQKIATRIIKRVPRRTHAAPLMASLGLESLSKRRDNHVLSVVSKCLNNACHPAVTELINNALGSINGSGNSVIRAPPRTVAGKRKFSYFAGELYKANFLRD